MVNASFTPYVFQNNPNLRFAYTMHALDSQMKDPIRPDNKFIQADAEAIHLLKEYYTELEAEDKIKQISQNILN